MYSEMGGTVKMDEFYFDPRRLHGKRGRVAGANPLSLGYSNAVGNHSQVYIEIVPNYTKTTLQTIIRYKIALGWP